MGARATEAVRRAIQHSQESLRARRNATGINQKTVCKWKGRDSVADLRTGLKQPRSTVLSVKEEAIVVASYEAICSAWAKQPERFTLNPLHQMPGLNI
jgi:hypothetical protein